jgi:uncharacterized BrkB/YihY/UPF0761 family membrane protein
LRKYVGLEESIKWIITVARWPLLFVAIGIALSFLYRYGPSLAEPQWRWVTLGSAFAALTWIGASLLFSWYATNFGRLLTRGALHPSWADTEPRALSGTSRRQKPLKTDVSGIL